VEQLDYATIATAQKALVDALVQRAGLPAGTGLAPYDPYWDLVFRAGEQVVGGQCDQYLDALFRFNREQRAGRVGLAATAATTGAIMGLAGVSAKAIAITAAAFGLTSSLFDAATDSVLFTIQPSAVRNVALQGRQKYLDDLMAKLAGRPISTQPDAMIALQGYLSQCSPAAIEANINNAATGAQSVVSTGTEGTKAAALAAPGTALLRTGTAPVVITAPLREHIEGAIGADEMAITPADGHKIQAALCTVPDSGKVTFGPRVRDAIALYRGSEIGQLQSPGPNAARAGLRQQEIGLLSTVLSCPTTCYRNAYEYFQFGPPADRQQPGFQKQHLKHLHDLLVPDRKDETFVDFCAPPTRSTIDRALTGIGKPSASGLSRDIMLQLEAEKLRSGPPTQLPPPATLPAPATPPAEAPAPATPPASPPVPEAPPMGPLTPGSR
jgi:hypothetical protein